MTPKPADVARRIAEARAELERLRPIVEAAVRANAAWEKAYALPDDPPDDDTLTKWDALQEAGRLEIAADDLAATERARRDGAGREGA